MRVFNSYQDLLTATTGEFGDAISSAKPSELQRAAMESMQKNGLGTKAEPLTMNTKPGASLQKLADATKRWEQLCETNPEEARMQLNDDHSEINQILAVQSNVGADVFRDSLRKLL